MTFPFGRRRARGAALFAVLAASVVILSALGSAVISLRLSAREHRHAVHRARARALALGAWAWARRGVAEEGEGFAGVGARPLGEGRIRIAAGPAAGGGVPVTATAEVKGDHGPVRAVVRGVLSTGAAGGEPAGAVLSMRVD